MTQHTMKVTTIGSSAGVVLNKDMLARLKVGKGDLLYATETPDGYMLRPYNAEFDHAMQLAEQIMREDRDVLKRLAE